MTRRAIAAIILSIVAVIGGMVLNFQEFLMGSTATEKNLFVTFVYIGIWIFVLAIGIKSKNRVILKYCILFWVLMLFLATLTVYVNATGASAGWALPLVVLLLGQWYGIRFFTGSLLTVSILMASISLIIFITSVIFFKRLKQT